MTFTASAAPVNTELAIYNGMGTHSVLVALPPDAIGFQSLTFSPQLGTAVPDSSDPLLVRYNYNSSGVDAFGISYLDGNGQAQTQIVTLVIFDDYTSEVVLDVPDQQSEKDFLGGLYNAFINPPQGTGGTIGSPGMGAGTGNGSGSMPPAGAEITVTGKNEVIVDGDSTPSLLDDTDFGVVNLGASVEHIFTVKNLGTSTLYVALNSLTGGLGWSITKYPISSLAPGMSDTFNVKFAPTAPGQSSTVVTITNNDADEAPYNFTLLASTDAPEIGVSGNGTIILDGDTVPSLIDGTDFGSISSGQFVDRMFTVKNSGSATLTLNPPQLPTGFSIVESLVSQLVANASDTFTVRFSPSVAGSYAGEISIGNNDSDETPFNFAIRGAIGAPEIEVRGNNQLILDGDSTPSLTDWTDFGSITTGQTVSRTFSVKNIGTATLTLQTPQLPDGFLLTEGLVSQLSSGASDTFTVRFSPSSTGTVIGDITIDNNDSDESPFNFAVKGVMNGPEITVFGNGFEIADGDLEPSSIDGTWFGTVGPGQTVERTFQVNNSGTSTLSLFLRSLPTGFTLVESLASSLPAGGTDSFTVKFAPTAVGSYGGEIKIDNNDADENPYNFAVFGMMGTPEIDVVGKGVSIVDGDNTPSILDDTYFGMTPPNIVATRTFTVWNLGTSVLDLSPPSLGPGSGFRLGSDTLVRKLEAGQSDTFSIELLSATPGTYTRTVTIQNTDSNESTYDFAISGVVGIPEIDVMGKGVSIVDGDPTPSLSDDTDFGTVLVSTPTTSNIVTKTFTVKNTGSGTLYLGTPSVTGTGFWRGAKTLATSLGPGQSDTFDVKFSSTAAGTFTGEVILYNSDANESPYNFTVKSRIGQPPTNIMLSPSSIGENRLSPARVGDLTATDPDVGDTHTFTLDPSFADGSRFSISGRTLFAAPLDFEDPHGPTYSFRVTATDSFGLSITKTLTVTVTNENEAPNDIILTPAAIPENHGSPSHIYVGNLTASDPDAGDTHSFALDTTFRDAADFSISGDTVYAKRRFDFEAAHGPTYSIKVAATDSGGLTFTKTLTITVTNVNEAPVIDPNQEFSIDENPTVSVTVGTVVFSDPDTADTHTVAITSGNTGNAFAISNAGVITVQTPGSINFEVNPVFTLQISVTDSGLPALTDVKTVVINIKDINEAPSIKDLDSKVNGDQRGSASFEFGPSSDNAVTTVLATDEDAGDRPALVFSLTKTSGPTGFDPFIIDESTGRIRHVRQPNLDDAAGIYTYQVVVSDPGGLQDTGSVSIELKSQRVELQMIDRFAVEGTADDTLKIVFTRDASPSYTALTVSFSTTVFNSADFVADADAATFFAGSITIPAGSPSASLTLTALPNVTMPPEIVEEGIIRILPSSHYVIGGLPEPIIIFDGVKLFIDGRPGSPDGHVVDRTDVAQGSHDDCFMLVVLANLAQFRPDYVTTMVRSVPSTPTPLDFQVRFYSVLGDPYWVDVTLDLNTSGVRLNGSATDHDGTNSEVWVKVIEQAYIDAFIDEVWFPADAYQNLTGQNGNTNAIYTSDAAILADIEAAIAAGNGVIWGTGPSPATLSTRLHAYSVSGVSLDPTTGKKKVIVYNPHGKVEEIQEDLLWENLGALTILEGRYGL